MAPVGQVDAALGTGAAAVSRRSVHSSSGQPQGFELRFGSGPPAGPGRAEPSITATLLDVFSRFGAADLFGQRPGYLNLTRPFLTGRLPLPVSPAAGTLLITADALGPGGPGPDRPGVPDGELLDGVRRLVASGYVLGLDGVPYGDELAPLIELVELVAIDDPAHPGISGDVERYRAHDVQLLARGIGSQDELNRCAAAGVELFEGSWFDRHDALDLASLGPEQSVALELVGRLSNPDVEISAVEGIVRHSPELAVRLLRIANSASSASRREVGSLHDAIMMVGVARLRSWMLLLSLAPSAGSADALVDALTRAATCEQLARASGAAAPESAFTVGLLDGVSEALGAQPAELLARIPALAGELVDALMGRPGPLRQVLDAVVGYQRGEFPADPDLPQHLLVEAYLQALAWTTRTSAATTS